ncbi:LPS export ABC transporter periplasmic protein LptC [Pseudaestuariivita atlantica]|uniref:LPS export ABC transporter periplasmic protein LptC n=1 Tax=Pseudaestuariivita atlantica TaxID=1317121 RepID=UPI00067D304D|nr:LPS export ABC transporter periplasmic protein LptC [Pseudaestuariivita atlantica]
MLLPLAALALLSTLFMLSSKVEYGDIPVAQRDLANRASKQQITAPYYTGATDDGALVSMTATAAKPDPDAPGRVSADGLWTRIDLSDGTVLTFRADAATIDEPEDRADLTGNVRIESSNGYVMLTEGLRSSMRAVAAESMGPVKATGPAGKLDAGKLKITADDASGAVQLVFTNGVKLVYEPAT